VTARVSAAKHALEKPAVVGGLSPALEHGIDRYLVGRPVRPLFRKFNRRSSR
jgi:hypothetical protein